MKRTHPKENYHSLKRRGSVYCPRCDNFINRGPNSNPVDELFLRRHQARSQECRNMPMPIVADAEFRDNDMNDHVDFGADRFNYDTDNDDNADEVIDFRLDDPVMTLREFNEATRRLDASIDFEVGAVQREENPTLRHMDVYNLPASDDILNVQREHLRLIEEEEIIAKFQDIRTPQGKSHKKKWEDLLDIYSFGTSIGISREYKNDLLAMMSGIHERNGVSSEIAIPRDWKSLDVLFSSSYSSLFETKTFEYALPIDVFGEYEEDGETPLKKMVGYALDVKRVLAEALLAIDPSEFSTTYRRVDGILDGFESGDVFRKISEDDKPFEPHHEYGQPISLCLSIRSDETTCNTSRTEKEMAVVISILNAKAPHYKMLFLGYVPIHLPYSEPILHDFLIARGIVFLRFGLLSLNNT